jgi:DNA-directed RNA polymerase specialized sigma24 family protein/ribosome-associated translation inhibitor RaiA
MNLHLTVQVPRSPELNQQIDRFHGKLEPLLAAFQPELVQLQGRIVRHTSREGVLCRLNLHLPTAQLTSEKAAATTQAAFRAAGDDLIAQLNKHKQRLRLTRPHVRRRRRGFVPPAPASGPGQAELAGYFGSHADQVLAFVRRQIELRENLGELPEGRLDPLEVMDEVVVRALSARPGSVGVNRGRWLLLLAAQAIRHLAKEYGDHPHGQAVQSLDARLARPQVDADPPGETRLDQVIAANRRDPEQVAGAAEALGRLATALLRLPPQQRHDLVLYLLEGFRPQELAALTHRSEADVRRSLEQAEAGLRAQPEMPDVLSQRLKTAIQPGEGRRRTHRGSMVPQRA